MPSKDNDVALIVPVYNEGQVIREVIREAKTKYNKVICVNDGSGDNSSYEIQKGGGILINHPINMGQGAALQTGINYALQDQSTEYLVTYDADGQHQLNDVAKLLKVIRDQKVDMVLGSRFLGRTENISRSKKALLKLAIKFSNITTGVKLTDTHNGLRVMSRRAAELMQLKSSDYAHASEIIERIAQKKLTYCEVPVTIVYTDYSKSKGQSLLNAINIASDMFMGKVFK